MKNLHIFLAVIFCCSVYTQTHTMRNGRFALGQVTNERVGQLWNLLTGRPNTQQLALVPPQNVTASLSTVVPTQPPQPPTVNVYLNTTNANNNTNTAGATNTTNVETNMTQVQKTFTITYNYFNDAGNYLSQKKNDLFDFCANNKKKIIFYACVAAYISAYMRLYYDRSILYEPSTWARWKENTPLETLYTIPSKDLTRELLLDIQGVYLDPKEPQNFIRPLTQFLQAIEVEEKCIKRYIRWSTWILNIRMSFFFPVNYTTLLLAQTQLTRLGFVKHLFISWAAEYKLNENLPAKRYRKSYTHIQLPRLRSMKEIIDILARDFETVKHMSLLLNEHMPVEQSRLDVYTDKVYRHMHMPKVRSLPEIVGILAQDFDTIKRIPLLKNHKK